MDATQLKTQPEEENIAKSKVAILWGREDVLVKAVEHLLTTRQGWKVTRISDECDADALAREVEKANPEVVIVHQGTYAQKLRLPIKLVRVIPK